MNIKEGRGFLLPNSHWEMRRFHSSTAWFHIEHMESPKVAVKVVLGTGKQPEAVPRIHAV